MKLSALVLFHIFWGEGSGDWAERREMVAQPKADGAWRALGRGNGAGGPFWVQLIELIVGAFCYWMVAKVKTRFGYDDSLDAFGVHCPGGTIGALLPGIFAVTGLDRAD